jgi:hypothetical protein
MSRATALSRPIDAIAVAEGVAIARPARRRGPDPSTQTKVRIIPLYGERPKFAGKGSIFLARTS